MKTKTNAIKRLAMFASLFLGIAVLATSCKDDDIEPGNSVNVKVVNAAEASGNQDVYVRGTKFTTVNENSSSNYIAVAGSGDDSDIEFKKAGSSEVYASDDFDLENNGYYTFFLTGTGNSAKVVGAEDDRSAPPSGQAKVRFIHLSTKAPANVDVYTISGTTSTKLASNLSVSNLTGYLNINPSFGIGVMPAGSTDMSQLQVLSIGSFTANNSYTVVIAGSTEVTGWIVNQNN